MKFIRMLLWIIAIPTGLLITILLYLYFNQDRIIFIPSTDVYATPDQFGLEYSLVRLEVEPGVVAEGWYFEAEGTQKTILFCHGNAGNISSRIGTAQFLLELGTNVLLFDYRGYGNSTGKPDETGVYADARAFYDWLIVKKHVVPDDLIIFGRSLGGAVAVELARNVTCGGLIIESAFTSTADMGAKLYPYIPTAMLVRHDFNSLAKMKELKMPVLVTHSPADEIIPFEMGRRLYDALETRKWFHELSGDHNDLGYFDDSGYVEKIKYLLAGEGTG